MHLDEPLASKHQRNPFDIVVVIGNYALDSFPSQYVLLKSNVFSSTSSVLNTYAYDR